MGLYTARAMQWGPICYLVPEESERAAGLQSLSRSNMRPPRTRPGGAVQGSTAAEAGSATPVPCSRNAKAAAAAVLVATLLTE